MIKETNWLFWKESFKDGVKWLKEYIMQIFSWDMSPKKLAKASKIFEKLLQKNPKLLEQIGTEKKEIEQEVDWIISDLKKEVDSA